MNNYLRILYYIRCFFPRQFWERRVGEEVTGVEPGRISGGETASLNAEQFVLNLPADMSDWTHNFFILHYDIILSKSP